MSEVNEEEVIETSGEDVADLRHSVLCAFLHALQNADGLYPEQREEALQAVAVLVECIQRGERVDAASAAGDFIAESMEG